MLHAHCTPHLFFQAKEGPELACSLCLEPFPDRPSLVSHVSRIHNRYKPDMARPKIHKCPQCSKYFSTSKDVRRHLVTHTRDRAFLCEFCPQTFARNDHLQRHYKTNHRMEWLEKTQMEKVSTHWLEPQTVNSKLWALLS
jgi:uncharacterized Zn-finger protein